ncbi:MAG TPA: exopolysaccharide biosynthesis polyprenyl glycosylphosphotransferase [Chitinophagaceae bacterium]|nr:exopolysaccharide biosynthesis polyprenyl glycosylphosphotransferase [Chitinophagaceae bacterium]
MFRKAGLFSAYANEVYIHESHFNFERFAKRSLKAFFLFCVIILLFIFLYHFSFSRLFVILNFVGFGLTIFLTRMTFQLMIYYLNRRNKFGKRVIILGYNDLSKRLVNHFLNRNQNISVEGYFENPSVVQELSFFPILGSREECLDYAIDNKINEIYSTLSPESNSYVFELAQIAESKMIRFKLVPDLQLFVNRNVHIDFVEDIPILALRSEPLEDITARIKKRLFDIIFSFSVIVLVLSWLLPLLAILIKLDAWGPVFFVQSRSGKNNRSFRCFKFRTLRVNKDGDLKQVTLNDSRLTRFGKFLRKSNLDELPQFINVLIGNMSVVGPRPHPIGFMEYHMRKNTDDHSRKSNEYMIRHFIKPGVTGWAQVNGFRGEIKNQEHFRKRVEHDIWYMENWSLWFDLRIVLLTVYETFRGNKNAY